VLAAARNRDAFTTAQFDGVVRLWRLGGSALPEVPRPGPAGSEAAALAPGGRHFLPITEETTAHVCSLRTGEPVGVPLALKAALRAAAFSPEGRRVVTLAGEGKGDSWAALRGPGWVEGWSWSDGKPLFPPVRTDTEPRGVAFSPDGKTLAVACVNGTTLLLDAATGGTIHRWQHPDTAWWYLFRVSVTSHPSGKWLLVGGLGRKAVVIETDTGRVRHTLGMPEHLTAATFSPDGRWVVLGSTCKEVRFWDVETGKEGLAPLKHPDWVFRTAFSGDGRYLVTSCRDGMARVWDWRRAVVLREMEHADEVYDARLSPDNHWVFTACRDGTVRLWEWLTGKPVSPPLSLGISRQSTIEARFSPDGRRLLAGSGAVFDLAPVNRPNPHGLSRDEMVLVGEVLSGQAVGSGGSLVNLNSRDWLAAWRRLRRAHPDYHAMPPARTAPRPAWPAPPVPPPDTVVELPARPVRRRATAAEVAGWVAELGGDRAEAAMRSLLEVGPGVRPAVREALRSADARTRRNAALVLDRIEVAEATAAPVVRLRLKGATPAEAFGALSRQTGVPIQYHGTSTRTVNLDLDGIGFWEAVDRLGSAAGVAPRLAQLYNGAALPVGDPLTGPEVHTDVGPFRIAVRNASYIRSVPFGAGLGPAGRPREGLYLTLAAYGVPPEVVVQHGLPRVKRAVAAGAALEVLTPQQGDFLTARPPFGLSVRLMQVGFKPPAERGGKIKKLHGELPLTVLLGREELASVPDLARAVQHAVLLRPGTHARLERPPTTRLRLVLTSTSGWRYDPAHMRFEVIDGGGQARFATAYPGPIQPAPAGFGAEGGALLTSGPGGVPWLGLALQTWDREPPRSQTVTLVLPPARDGRTWRGLRLVRVETRQASIPFVLRDVPLP
jgi:WD40 repeat protein